MTRTVAPRGRAVRRRGATCTLALRYRHCEDACDPPGWRPGRRRDWQSSPTGRLTSLKEPFQVHTNTFAGRMGRWSAQHRKKAIWGWIAFVVIAFAVGNAVGTKQPTHDDYVGQSGQAEKLFADHFAKKDGEQVIVQAPKGGKATDATVRAAVAQTIAAVSGKPGVT